MDKPQEVIEIDELQALIDGSGPHLNAKREKNFFEVGLRGHYENPTTELLRFFIDPNNQHGLGKSFYHGILLALNLSEHECGSLLSVETEVVTESGGRIDLIISTENYIIAIECKVYHHQENPFHDYMAYVEQLCQTNECIPRYAILCIDGISSQPEWTGVSYQSLVQHTSSHLSKSLLENPLNKWGVLAREFLMHLARFGENSMNDAQFEFVKNNILNINKLIALKSRFADEVAQRVKLESEHENIHVKFSKKGDIHLRFRYSEWESNDDVLLYHEDTGDVTCFNVKAFIENPSPELVEAFHCQLDRTDMNSSTGSYREAGWWGCEWNCQNPETAISLVSKSLTALDVVGRIRFKSANPVESMG